MSFSYIYSQLTPISYSYINTKFQRHLLKEVYHEPLHSVLSKFLLNFSLWLFPQYLYLHISICISISGYLSLSVCVHICLCVYIHTYLSTVSEKALINVCGINTSKKVETQQEKKRKYYSNKKGAWELSIWGEIKYINYKLRLNIAWKLTVSGPVERGCGRQREEDSFYLSASLRRRKIAWMLRRRYNSTNKVKDICFETRDPEWKKELKYL